MNLDKIINLIREMNEEAPTVSTGSSGATAGFSGGASTPVAGYNKPMKFMRRGRKRFPGARDRWKKGWGM